MAATDQVQFDIGATPQTPAATQPPPGLINAAPGMTDTTPGTSSVGSGAPVTSYTPDSATATTYTPKAYTVDPATQTVAGQIRGLIDAGSPLLDQAEASARNQMNARGLINSTQAITAGQSALYNAALPIAQADAQTYDKAATNTTTAENTAGGQNSQLQTQTSQFNTGQTNAALTAASAASNQKALTQMNNESAANIQKLQNQGQQANIALQGDINTKLQKMQDDNKLLLQTSQSASQLYQQGIQYMGTITANKDLSTDQKTNALNNMILQINDGLKTMGDISATIPDLNTYLYFTNGS